MKFNKIFSALTAGILLFGAAACTDETEYTPAAVPQGNEVYFSTEESNEVSLKENAESFTVVLSRLHSAGELTVGLTGRVVDEEGNIVTDIFTLPTQATFADGQVETDLEVGVDFSKVEPEAVYYMNLKVDGSDETTPYGASEVTFNVSYAPWTELEIFGGETEEGVYSYQLFLQETLELPVFYQKNLLDDNLERYFVPNVFSAMNYLVQIDMNKTDTFDNNGVECVYVSVPSIYTEYNNYIVSDMYCYPINELGWTPEQAQNFIDNNGYARSYFNPVEGRFYLSLGVFVGTSIYGNAVETLQLPGDYKDYYITFTRSGNFVDKTGMESLVFNAVKSADVNSFAYRNVAGEPTEAEITALGEQIAENFTDETLIEAENSNITIPFTEAGRYTLLGFGFDEGGNLVCTSKLTYTAETVMAAPEWHDLGWVEYTDGFIYGIYGTDAFIWDVMLQEHNETPGYYRLVNPYKDWPGNPNGMYSLEGNYYLYIDATDPNHVMISDSSLGLILHPDDGEMFAMSLGYMYVSQGWSISQVEAQLGKVFGTLEDDVITFPTQGLLVVFENDPEQAYYANCLFANGAVVPNSGEFCVDMSGLNDSRSAAPLKSRRNKPVALSSLQRVKAQTIKNENSNIFGARKAVYTTKEINDLRKPVSLQ